MHHRELKHLFRDESGSILLLVGLSLLVLFAIAGAGVDLGRQQLVHQKIQQSSDAAALAGADMPASSTDAQRISTAQRYFNLNYPASYLGVSRPTPSITVPNNTVKVDVAPVTFNTSFMSVVGISTVTASGSSTVQISSTTSSDYDVVMVVDETGSTSNPVGGGDNSIRIVDMRNALTAMANSIVPVGNTNPNVRMGFMGYSSHITNKWGLSNKNADALTAISKLRPTCNNYDFTGMYGGLNMLLGGQGAPNAQINYPDYFLGYPYNYTAYGDGICKVDSNTTAPYPLTPRTNPSDSNGISMVKNVVFLTDGDIMTDPAPCGDPYDGRNYAPYGSYPNCYSSPTFRNYPQFLASCNAIKAVSGTHIFVVNFASPPAGALTAMQSCASTNPSTGLPDFYYAANSASLLTILNNITTQIQKVHIIQ